MTTLSNLNSKEVPEDFCVIRVKNRCNYLHSDGNLFFFKEKMHGCFVCRPEVSEEILKDLQIFKSFSDLEIVYFKDAYNQHGIIEMQVAYN
jgi:hypothetical protein